MLEIGSVEADELFGEYLRSKCSKIEEVSKRLDVFSDGDNHSELLNNVLLALGDEVGDEGEDTFFNKVKRLDDILGTLGDYPY